MQSSSVKLYHEMTLGSIIIAMETRPLEKLVILQSYIDFLSAKDLTIFAIITNQYLPQFQQYMNILIFFTTPMIITKPRFYFILAMCTERLFTLVFLNSNPPVFFRSALVHVRSILS